MLEALDRQNLLLIPLDDRRRLVSLPPPVRGRAPGAPARRAARARGGAASAGDRVVRAGRRTRRGDPPRHGRQRLRASRRPGRAGDPGDGPRPAGGDPPSLARGAPRRADPGAARAEQRVRGVAAGAWRDDGVEARLQDAERWLEDGRMPATGAIGPPGWSSWTRRRSGRCRPRSPSTGPAWPGSSAMSPAPWPTPDERSSSSVRTTTSAEVRPPTLLGLAYWARGDLEAATGLYLDAMASLEKAGYLSDVIGLAHRPGRHADRAGSPERGDAHVSSGAWRSRPAGRSSCGERRTCTSVSARSSASAMTSLAPRSICIRPGSWARRTACRRTPIGRAWLLPDPPGGRRSRRGPRAPRRGGSPLRRRLLAGCAPGRCREGAGVAERRAGSRRRGAGRASTGCRRPTT